MDKMKIKILDRKLKPVDGKVIDVLFNPHEYSINNSNQIASNRIRGIKGKIAQFTGGDLDILKMQLFFDTYTLRNVSTKKYEDVRKYTNQIKELLSISSDDHAPPICEIIWGSLDFRGYLQSLDEKFVMFSDEGIPLRAKLDVSFKEIGKLEQFIKKASPQSADRTKARVLKEGEQLWNIAENEYDDPSNWRAIADANNIHNPRKVKAGTSLVVPSLR